MPDREKVIKGLECCAGQCNYHGCPYKDPCENANGVKQIMLDALELLKEQENNLLIQHEEGFHDGYGQALCELHDKQFVKVVRCEDCEYSYTEGFVHPHLVCEKHPEFESIQGDWFCADGWKA